MRTLLVAALVLSAGCKKQPPPPPPEPVAQPEPQPEPRGEEEAVAEMMANFERVYFDFDSSTLAQEAMDALSANAKIMQEFPNLRVEVQGHADERGTTDYNLALGQKRAQSVKEHMARMGVADARIAIVSFGEEKPLAAGSGESAWTKNRRAEFRVLSGPSSVEGTVE